MFLYLQLAENAIKRYTKIEDKTYTISDWQDIICGSEDSYLNKIIKAHFDGVYLDIIDAFEYYEKD